MGGRGLSRQGQRRAQEGEKPHTPHQYREGGKEAKAHDDNAADDADFGTAARFGVLGCFQEGPTEDEGGDGGQAVEKEGGDGRGLSWLYGALTGLLNVCLGAYCPGFAKAKDGSGAPILYSRYLNSYEKLQ